MNWEPSPRADGRMEYTCEHGVGHGNGVHGCCHERCCNRDDFPLKNIKGEVFWLRNISSRGYHLQDEAGNIILYCTKCGDAWIRPEVTNIWRDTYCPPCWDKHNAAIS